MNRAALGWVRAYRVFFALLTLVAVVYQFWERSTRPAFVPLNFFSFFTIQSNLIGIAVLLWGALRSADLVRGAAVTYLSITGVVYGLLLSDLQEQLQTTVPWVDTVLHKVMPLVMVVDWLVDPPAAPIAFRRALVWLIYPLLYAAYSLVRGALVGWYPYPFLDPAASGGYGAVALTCVGIALGALLFTWMVVTLGRRVRLTLAPA